MVRWLLSCAKGKEGAVGDGGFEEAGESSSISRGGVGRYSGRAATANDGE
jgi:hypothetical protein